MTTLSIVNAIISVGNGLIAAQSGGSSPTSNNGDNLKKSLESLRDLLLPEDKTEKVRRDKRVIDILAAEAAKGPIQVRKMSTSSKSKGRIKRRRSDIDGRKQSES